MEKDIFISHIKIYDILIESYFSSDKYSNLLQDKLARYEVLSKSRTESEMDEFLTLKNYFSSLPKYLSHELHVKLQQIELSLLGQKNEMLMQEFGQYL